MSKTATRGIEVEVRPQFVDKRLDEGRMVWLHAYHVTITNRGAEAVQLLTRHWIITDATGRERHVRGDGVVGQQPSLPPGQSHQYSSGCPLPTSMGTMHGSYRMVTDDGEQFDAEIAPLTLAEPGTVN